MSEPGQTINVGRRLFSVGGDIVAGVSVVGSIVQWLPSIAAVCGIVWYLIQIRESRSWREFRHHCRRWRYRRRLRKAGRGD